MIKPSKTPMPLADAEIRKNNFSEVALGYTQHQAINEASRCLQCLHKPCVASCPVNVDIPGFILAIKEDRLDDALSIIHQTNCFPSICGRVCPQEVQCESTCVMAKRYESVAIGRLERYVGDHARLRLDVRPLDQQFKVAVVGSGPSGLACAYDCAKEGYAVTVFEAWHDVGGVLRYGIPEFRLPKATVDKEIDVLRQLGVEFECNVVIGKTIECAELFEMGYKAVFIGTGAGLPTFMNIEGEGSIGVFSANEFLTRVNFMKAGQPSYDTPILTGKRVVVVGGGNVAMDAARCAKRLGYETTIVYRRSLNELPARQEEVEHAMEEDIHFELLAAPVKIFADQQGRVRSVLAQRMQLTEPGPDGRCKVVATSDQPFEILTDTVIVAIGTSPNPILIRTTKDLKTGKWGTITVDENQQTSIEHVYAGGDAVTGAATVIEALGAGKKAAASIIGYFRKQAG
jgi:glutamate synthase (NADPH) small chain